MGKQYNATYLPEVALAQKWSKLSTIENLVNKAGHDGAMSDVEGLSVTKYQSCKANMTWNEYVKYTQSSDDFVLLRERIDDLENALSEERNLERTKKKKKKKKIEKKKKKKKKKKK